MLTMIVATQIFVTREAVQMHVDYLNVERMLNVKALSIQQSVYVCQVTQGIPDLHVLYVSLRIISIGSENLDLFICIFYSMSFCMNTQKACFQLQLDCQQRQFYLWDVFKMKTVLSILHVRIPNVSIHVRKITHVLQLQFARF